MTVITTQPAATATRARSLADYMNRKVMDSQKNFTCASYAVCRTSAEKKPGVEFFEGQLSHVGLHYDTSVDGRAFRVLVVPLDAGNERRRVSLVERREEQVRFRIGESWGERNQHMKGVVMALRVAFGGEAGTDSQGEWLRTPNGPVHVFDAFAMANLTLCSAIKPRREAVLRGTASQTTSTMRRNCVSHLAATISILEPTLIIGQGGPVRDSLTPLLSLERRVHDVAWVASLDQNRFVWVPLKHPSRNWFSPRSEYLKETVVPAISKARSVALTLGKER